MAHLCSEDMDRQRLIELARDHNWPSDALIMAFTPSRFKFEAYRFDEAFLAESDQGRIFSESGELRWRRLGGIIRVVYLGDSPPAGLTDHSRALENHEREISERILWGRRTDKEDEWIEQQTPQFFRYPVSAPPVSRGRVALRVENWRDAGGIPRFARYCGLKQMEGEKADAKE